MNKLEASNNLNVEFGAYVHFAYYVGRYLMQQCEDESCEESIVVKWYLDRFGGLLEQTETNSNKLRRLYGNLVNNIIRDDCVTVVAETPDGRILKRHPSFFVWAWRAEAKSHERSLLST